MKVDPLPPIPSPPAHMWRQFRVKLMPLASFVVVLGVTVWLWQQNLANPMLVGTAAGARADVISPQTGRLAELRVTQYQYVRAGDPVAVVEAMNPAVLSNTVSLLRAEMQVILANMGLRPADKLRYGQYQLEWLRERTDLMVARAKVGYAERELERVTKLSEDNVASESRLDQERRDYEVARQLVAQKEASVEKAATLLHEMDPARRDSESPSVKAALAVLEERVRLAEVEMQPVVLASPIDGVVSDMAKYPGEIVGQADPIVTIASPRVDRIVGFIAQPIRLDPVIGMQVEVRSRGLNRSTGLGHITHVGPRIELFDAPLRVRGMGNAQQRGLPIVVNVPENLRLRPGELVDLAIRDYDPGRPQAN